MYMKSLHQLQILQNNYLDYEYSIPMPYQYSIPVDIALLNAALTRFLLQLLNRIAISDYNILYCEFTNTTI